MAMQVGPADEDEDGALNSAINTTPLVDVMLVLLIIFLITIPVVTKTVKVKLPNETNIATVTKPQNIVIAIDKEGGFYWNNASLPDRTALLNHLKSRSTEVPQPEVHIRADRDTNYKYIGEVMIDCQRAGIAKVAFITEPQHGILSAQ
jgi:biopolymer transport protein ExbD